MNVPAKLTFLVAVTKPGIINNTHHDFNVSKIDS